MRGWNRLNHIRVHTRIYTCRMVVCDARSLFTRIFCGRKFRYLRGRNLKIVGDSVLIENECRRLLRVCVCVCVCTPYIQDGDARQVSSFLKSARKIWRDSRNILVTRNHDVASRRTERRCWLLHLQVATPADKTRQSIYITLRGYYEYSQPRTIEGFLSRAIETRYA